ncbi:MAG: ferrous iron transport protein A [Deltaproteobacteria bacterium]|nr:ferrous iron transport protein A [Deltaproteobacteria bacterium]
MDTGTISLRRLRVGEKAVIASIAAKGELGRRIRDMGLVPGAAIEIVGRAPLRDPVALRLQGFTLTLRNNEADWITVTLPEGEDAGAARPVDGGENA